MRLADAASQRLTIDQQAQLKASKAKKRKLLDV
jgi:hypothetical protein